MYRHTSKERISSQQNITCSTENTTYPIYLQTVLRTHQYLQFLTQHPCSVPHRFSSPALSQTLVYNIFPVSFFLPQANLPACHIILITGRKSSNLVTPLVKVNSCLHNGIDFSLSLHVRSTALSHTNALQNPSWWTGEDQGPGRQRRPFSRLLLCRHSVAQWICWLDCLLFVLVCRMSTPRHLC